MPLGEYTGGSIAATLGSRPSHPVYKWPSVPAVFGGCSRGEGTVSRIIQRLGCVTSVAPPAGINTPHIVHA